MKISSMTDTGRVRTCNQDAYAHGLLSDGSAWAVVCDGMGGANGGDYASTSAVEIIANVVKNGWRGDLENSSIRNLLEVAIKAANVSINYASQHNDSLSGMGTTVVLCIISNGSVHIAYAGDSRAYHLRGDEIVQVTTDHSVVQAMVDSGQITQDEARNHPRRNLITRALGVFENIDVDYCNCPFESGDKLLVCTDGLSNCVTDEQLVLLMSGDSCEDFAQQLVDAANENGGSDNITAVVICS